MQHTRNQNRFGNAVAWLQHTYSSLKLDSLVIFGVVGLMIALMCAGAYQEAVTQAYAFLNMTSEQNPTVMELVNIVNQYGLAALIALCYFSNVSEGGTRRELTIDLLTIAVGFLMPTLVFHASWLYITNDLISTFTLTVNHVAVNAINLEWVIVWVVSLLLVGAALLSWRIAGQSLNKAQ